MYGPYGTLPYGSSRQLVVKQPDSYLDYTESVAAAITDPVTGVVDPLVSLSLTASPSGDGELALSRLSVDSTGLLVTWWEADGVPGRNYTISLDATTVAGRIFQWQWGQICNPSDALWPLPPVPNPGPGTPVTWTANGTLTAFGGYVALSTLGQWPTSSGTLPPGSFYANTTPAASYINAVPGSGYVPGPPVFLGQITGDALLALGAMSFPQADPHVVWQFYMNGGFLCVSSG